MPEKEGVGKVQLPKFVGSSKTISGDPVLHTLPHPGKRGLLASPQLEGQPVKGVYFFAGETKDPNVYTAHPLDIRDQQWNSHPETRPLIIDRMLQANVNTIVMSYWREFTDDSPMDVRYDLKTRTLPGLLDAVEHKPIVIMPAIEGGNTRGNAFIHWQFKEDFPTDNPEGLNPSLGLVDRIFYLLELFEGRMHLWAQMYDRNDYARYAINIIQTSSLLLDPDDPLADDKFANGFDKIEALIQDRHGILIGFTIDAVGDQRDKQKNLRYSAKPDKAGPVLERTNSILAIQGFASEIFSTLIIPGSAYSGNWRTSSPRDNNEDNINNLINWRRATLLAWIQTGIPVIFDVSNGYDGRIIFADKGGTAFWGDNLQYTDDRWRNGVSQLKGPGIKGITFNVWNGYTEGFVAVPTHEHGTTVYKWLQDCFEPAPSDFSHMHYVNGARTHRVYGAICAKWIEFGGENIFGAPVSDELPGANGGRKQHFLNGKSIYWHGETGAHEVHGKIREAYVTHGAEAGSLGYPITDEKGEETKYSKFQRGEIYLNSGDEFGTVIIQLHQP